MTNADVIRKMTDKQLFDFLSEWECGDIDYSITFCDLCMKSEAEDGKGNELGLDCDGCREHWLKRDAVDYCGLLYWKKILHTEVRGMSKYIKLEDAIHNINLEVTGRKEYTGDMKANLFFALDDIPTIDIVHCKDCTFAKPTNTENVIQCTWLSGYTFRKDHYCSAGERKEE